MKFGGKIVFTSALCFGALANIAIPFASRLHYSVLIALRVITGLVTGLAYPAGYAIFASWVPPMESTRLIGITMAGKFGF